MAKFYEEPQITVFLLTEEAVRTSTGGDPFNDDYTDFGDGNGNT